MLGAQAEAAEVFVLGEQVTQRGAERPGEDVGDPERQHLSGAEPAGEPGEQDQPAEDQRAVAEAEAERLGGQVAGGGAEGEGGQDRAPSRTPSRRGVSIEVIARVPSWRYQTVKTAARMTENTAVLR